MFQRNVDVRTAIKESGLRQWMVAEKIGLTDGNFSRLLRHELPLDKKAEIYTIIDELKKELLETNAHRA